ncbi:hypothetical protein E4U41_003621 [Claviceps citrina]|nr:hypothetical protein E4U41_003621 [Claviceps citrina]
MARNKPQRPQRPQKGVSAPPSPSTLPNWPRFDPPLPVAHLVPEPHPLTPKIVTIPSFFPKSLCRDYVTFLRTLPLQTTPGRPKRGEAVRVNDRFQVSDAAFAARLWERTGLKEALLGGAETGPVGLNPNIRVYRYSKGQYFDCHYDDSNNLTLPTEPPMPVRTTWTLLLYLTSSAEGCVGGETVFYPRDRSLPEEAMAVSPETGTLLLHKHGEDCLLVTCTDLVLFFFSLSSICSLCGVKGGHLPWPPLTLALRVSMKDAK